MHCHARAHDPNTQTKISKASCGAQAGGIISNKKICDLESAGQAKFNTVFGSFLDKDQGNANRHGHQSQ